MRHTTRTELPSEETVIESPATPASRAVPVEPLLGDTGRLRAQWQRVQAGFVDDPQTAVDDAADLVEQTAQALIGALRQRQQELRVLREHGAANISLVTPAGSGGTPDTENLRVLMRRYRTLFNQLCRS
jgi:hypothetical protein